MSFKGAVLNLRTCIGMSIWGFKNILGGIGCTCKGQKDCFAILQTSHRLEKGLTIRNPRPGWGWDKAEQLLALLGKEIKSKEPDAFAVETGRAVLAAYLQDKEAAGTAEEQLQVKKLCEKMEMLGFSTEPDLRCGGALTVCKEQIAVTDEAAVRKLFFGRHSVRDFADAPVNREDILRAVELALRAPSACNRQPTRVYVVSAQDREKLGFENTYCASHYILLTGCMSAFSVSELNDWIVSTSIFAGYLSIALHAVGIGSCVMRKTIIGRSKYNDAMRKHCNIPEDEQIVIEMPVGNYKDTFKIAYSNRTEATDITRFV